MQIQLKQTEIEHAIKAFISQQGINLSGKSVEIAFTSGRKDNGLSADISIEDAAIPGFTDADGDDAPAPVGTPFSAVPPKTMLETAPVTFYAAVDAKSEPSAVVPEADKKEKTEATKAASLFS